MGKDRCKCHLGLQQVAAKQWGNNIVDPRKGFL